MRDEREEHTLHTRIGAVLLWFINAEWARPWDEKPAVRNTIGRFLWDFSRRPSGSFAHRCIWAEVERLEPWHERMDAADATRRAAAEAAGSAA